MRVLPPIPAAVAAASTTERLRQDVQRRLKAAALSCTVAPPRRFVPARDGYWDGYAYTVDPAFPEFAAAVARRHAEVASAIVATRPASLGVLSMQDEMD